MAQDLRIVKTRSIIKNALIELMAEKGVSDITITELSTRALINRKTFYRHYSSVSAVVSEIENEILSEFADTLKSSNTSCLDVVGVVADITALVERRREYFAKMLKLNPDLFSMGRIKAMLRRAVEVSLKNSMELHNERTLSAISQFMVSGVLALYSEWFDNGCSGSLDHVTDIAKRFITDGLKGFVTA
ncbi:MAG: TetR/AcrR family transcriptional regulator [Oscillospiraceae bacterium]|nr:TetR/AcrR family transcriptional regulator [Oscillospiraceae bacterium]